MTCILHILVIVSGQFQLSARQLYKPRPPSGLNTWDVPRINYSSWATLETTELSKYEAAEPDTARLPGSGAEFPLQPSLLNLSQQFRPHWRAPRWAGGRLCSTLMCSVEGSRASKEDLSCIHSSLRTIQFYYAISRQ